MKPLERKKSKDGFTTISTLLKERSKAAPRIPSPGRNITLGIDSAQDEKSRKRSQPSSLIKRYSKDTVNPLPLPPMSLVLKNQKDTRIKNISKI